MTTPIRITPLKSRTDNRPWLITLHMVSGASYQIRLDHPHAFDWINHWSDRPKWIIRADDGKEYYFANDKIELIEVEEV